MTSGDKETPKREDFASALRFLMGGCTREPEMTAMAPLNLPKKWARILRMSSTPKIPIVDYLEVKLQPANSLN